jgi:hypothetical protein
MKKSIKLLTCASVIVVAVGCATQKGKQPPVPANTANKAMPPAGTNTVGGATPATGTSSSSTAPRTGPKSFASFFDQSKLRTQKGLIIVHFQDDKYYFEIPNTLMGKDFLTVTRFVRMTPGAGTYGGEQANDNVLRFERGPENKIFLRTILNVVSSPDSTKPIYQAVRNSNVDPIAAAFDIKAFSRDTSGVIIDVTDFFKSDNQIVSLTPRTKRAFNLTSIASDRSYIETIKSFKDNAEIRTVKTFNAAPPSSSGQPIPGQVALPAAAVSGMVTLEMNTSFIRLPDVPMKRRFFDPRVGYWRHEVSEFVDTAQRANTEVFIARWRLEPKEEDIAKYKRGELVEPKKPIVFYIDPGTPSKWVPYLIQGINDWQVAFEKAGFRNAIIGKVWPKDSSMSLEAANYSAIRYLASDIANAYGPYVHDPRSGEIFESHIGWYHNVMQLVQNWYFIQAAAIDPGARKMKFDDDLMGNLIRFVSSHEVGHTIGLRHNMGTSSFTPVEKLRDKAWVEKNGHTLSIMDYARFNYVAQPEDNIGRAGIYPRIGAYDLWAIEWGYRWTDGSEEEDKKLSNRMIVERLKNNPQLWFGGEGNNFDPRAQREDLSNNAMKASEYGIKNLKIVVRNLPEWTKEEGDRFENLKEMYGAALGQFNRYAGHVIKNIGGIEETFKSVEEAGNVYAPTSKATQRSAVNWLHQQVFTTPTWLLDRNILDKITEPVNNNLGTVQNNIMTSVLSASRLYRMNESTNRFGSSSYSVLELLADMKDGIFKEMQTGSTSDMYRRNLQKTYVERIIALLPSPASTPAPGAQIVLGTGIRNTDIPSIALGHLSELLPEVRSAIGRTSDKVSRYHLMDLAKRIDQVLNPK